jgi:hypothetical protein
MNITKKQRRERRALKTRAKIRELGTPRLTVHRTPRHIYAQVFAADGSKVLAAASTVQKAVAKDLKRQGRRCGESGVRPVRFPVSRPRQGAGRCRPRSRARILRPRQVRKTLHGKN